MGLLSRILPGRRHDTGLPTTSPEAVANTLPLPPATSKDDQTLWSFQMAKARTLWTELQRDTANDAAKSREKRLAGGPPMAVIPQTLLEAGRGAGERVRRVLHANHVSPGVVVMAMPRADEASAWADQAASHGVSHVVRIGTSKEAKIVGLDGFDPASGQPPRSALKQAARTWDVAAAPEVAISPRGMLELFDKMARHPPDPGRAVAFQSPDGDDRSAVFAAGWKLHQAFTRAEKAGKPFDAEDVADVVQEACMALRYNRSSSLIGGPEHIASLLTLGTLLLSRPPQVKQVRFEPGYLLRTYVRNRRMPVLPRDTSHADRLAMRRLAATGTQMDEEMAPLAARAKQLYKPIPGGSGHYRLHVRSVIPPDARLQALNAAPLHGAWAGPETLILERLHPSQNLAWAQACLRHNITAVVDLTSNAERLAGPDAMGKGVHAYGDGTQARFDWRLGPELELGAELADAKVRAMMVSATIDGKAETRDMGNEPAFDRSTPPTERPLEFVRVGLEPRRAIPPSRLLAIARLMELHRSNGTHEVVAVQCPPGDARAAVVAAADAIHTRFQLGELDSKNARDVVGTEWGRLIRDYSPDLWGQPDHVASLLGMTELMLQENKRTSRW